MANIETSDYEAIDDQDADPHTYMSVGTESDNDRTDPASEPVEDRDQHRDSYMQGRLTPVIGIDHAKEAPRDTVSSRLSGMMTYENVANKDQTSDTDNYMAGRWTPVVGIDTTRGEAPRDTGTARVSEMMTYENVDKDQNSDTYLTVIAGTNIARETSSDRATLRVSRRTVDEAVQNTDQNRDTYLTPATKEVHSDPTTTRRADGGVEDSDQSRDTYLTPVTRDIPTFPWRTVCILLFSGIFICIVISTITGVIVYNVLIGSIPSNSPDQQSTGTSDAMYGRINNVVQIVMQETLNSSVAGGWSAWSPWEHCSVSCGVGLQRRDRNCSNPYPGTFGEHCVGDAKDYKSCFERACTSGAWSGWSSWGSCSVTCNGGLRSRTRTCTNPAPTQFGMPCLGNNMDKQICNTTNCPVQQIAFLARRPTGTLVGHNCPTFSEILTNIGNAYNQSSGQFRAPVAGLYSFSLTLVAAKSRSGNLEIYCWIQKNDAFTAIATTREGVYDSASVSAFMHLSAGHFVDLLCARWVHIYKDPYTVFTGALIRAD